MGAPAPVRLVEIGPGRGTLMADALRALGIVPDLVEAATVHLVETSPRLRCVQARTLAAFRPLWHERIEEVPEGPVIVLANEVFDALPVRQFVRTQKGWRERVVGVVGDRLAFGLSPDPVPPSAVPPAMRAAPLGAFCEVSPAAQALARTLGGRIAQHGGAALIIDYGRVRSGPGETLQAVRGHAPADPLAEPGRADLTAHVDFEALGRAAAAEGARIFGPLAQGDLLRALGIEARASRLGAQATEAQKRDIAAALERLTAPERMGGLFKALALAQPGLAPPGFDFDDEAGKTRPERGCDHA